MTELNKLKKESPTFLVDYAATEIDDLCGMRFWLSQLEGGRGIINKTAILPALLLAEVHADMRAIAGMTDISPVAIQAAIDGMLAPLSDEDKLDQSKMELLYRRFGWLAAFALFMEPAIRMDYEPLPIDTEVILDREPLWVIAHPDRLLRNKANGEVTYREYVPMTPGITNQKWLHSWLFNMRMHLGLAAAAEDSGQDIAYGQVMGLAEGYTSVLDGRLAHPYVWGYHNHQTQEWSNVFKSEKDGWVVAPVWKFPGGVVSWVRMCGQHTADAQFPLSPPVFLNKSMLDNWVERQVHRARQVRVAQDVCTKNKHLRGIHFERRTSACRPATGDPCPFLGKCWGCGTKDDEYVANLQNEASA